MIYFAFEPWYRSQCAFLPPQPFPEKVVNVPDGKLLRGNEDIVEFVQPDRKRKMIDPVGLTVDRK